MRLVPMSTASSLWPVAAASAPRRALVKVPATNGWKGHGRSIAPASLVCIGLSVLVQQNLAPLAYGWSGSGLAARPARLPLPLFELKSGQSQLRRMNSAATRTPCALCSTDAAASAAEELHSTPQNTANAAASNAMRAHTRPAKFVPFPFDYHEEIVVNIEGLTNRGHGIARVEIPSPTNGHSSAGDGSDEKTASPNDQETTKWVVMVPNVIPGERVRARIFRNFNSYSEADLIDVIEPSPDRTEPRCDLAGICGGCQLQHMSIQAQRDWKKRLVLEGLAQHGISEDEARASDCIGTDEVFGYRSKLTPHYQYPSKSRRGRKNVDVQTSEEAVVITAIGFQKSTARQIIDVPFCPIGTPEVNAEYARARDRLLNNPPPGKKKKGATLLFRQGELNDDHIETNHNEYLITSVGRLRFRYRAGNFFQNNYFVLPLMVQEVVRHATRDDVMTHLADCYCGSGLFALSASEHFDKVVGIEINDQAIEEATANAVSNNVTNCEFRAASAENIFEAIKDFPNDNTVVVLDPPRKGCSTDFLMQLYTFAPRRIVYMSCDPSTQARDAKGIIAAGYGITSTQPFDLFPQTRHIECLMVFERL